MVNTWIDKMSSSMENNSNALQHMKISRLETYNKVAGKLQVVMVVVSGVKAWGDSCIVLRKRRERERGGGGEAGRERGGGTLPLSCWIILLIVIQLLFLASFH